MKIHPSCGLIVENKLVKLQRESHAELIMIRIVIIPPSQMRMQSI